MQEVYFYENLDIVPLRFVYQDFNRKTTIKDLEECVDFDYVWFKEPVIGCKDKSKLGYNKGDCPVAEEVSRNIINFPVVLPEKWQKSIGENK